MEIRGARYNEDARKRSDTGLGVFSYTDDPDPLETTIHGGTAQTTILISSSNVVLDGLSITSSPDDAYDYRHGFFIDSPECSSAPCPGLSDITIKNCVIRNIVNTKDGLATFVIFVSRRV